MSLLREVLRFIPPKWAMNSAALSILPCKDLKRNGYLKPPFSIAPLSASSHTPTPPPPQPKPPLFPAILTQAKPLTHQQPKNAPQATYSS